MKKKTLYIGGGVLSLAIVGALVYYFFLREDKEDETIKLPFEKKNPTIEEINANQLAGALQNKANLNRLSAEQLENLRKNAAASKRVAERTARDLERKNKRLTDQINAVTAQINEIP